MIAGIFAALAVFTLAYLAIFVASLRKMKEKIWPGPAELATGFVTNFFDTLGIGSFATTTAIFKFRKMVPDELIPGTLNAGHTLPTIFQAFIYVSVIEVDVTTLVAMIASTTIGAWFGADLVAKLSRRAVQLGMGGALITAATTMLMSQFHLFPAGGVALKLTGLSLAIGMLGGFLFGALSTLGIGCYAPCMTLLSLLGMNPVAAFPIMMGSSAFSMPVSSSRFVLSGVYSARVAVGLAIGGMLGVPIAAFFVKSLPLTVLRWLTVVVVLYAAVLMIRSARSHK